MYKIHASDGILLQKRAVGESHIFASIFTEDLGLVRVIARSARLERSKLRYILEPFTAGHFSIVRGKHEWRLTGAQDVRSILPQDVARRRAMGRIGKLLLRLVAGQEAHAELFVTVKEGFGALARVESAETAEAVECVLVLRILADLGYLPATPEIAPFLERDFFGMELSDKVVSSRKTLIKAINESLEATGL
jgi:DNA repair protein RecO